MEYWQWKFTEIIDNVIILCYFKFNYTAQREVEIVYEFHLYNTNLACGSLSYSLYDIQTVSGQHSHCRLVHSRTHPQRFFHNSRQSKCAVSATSVQANTSRPVHRARMREGWHWWVTTPRRPVTHSLQRFECVRARLVERATLWMGGGWV